jgi:hypothetical protein
MFVGKNRCVRITSLLISLYIGSYREREIDFGYECIAIYE